MKNFIRKLKFYRQCIIEVNDNGEIFCSVIPWHFFFFEKIFSFLGIIKYDKPFSITFLPPWKINIS